MILPMRPLALQLRVSVQPSIGRCIREHDARNGSDRQHGPGDDSPRTY
jgi:hypothetical protein